MPAGEQNNIRSKMEAFTVIPSNISFDQKRGWTRVEKELKAGRQKKKRSLILVAAALGVFFVTGSLFYVQRTSHSVPAITVLQKLPDSDSHRQSTTSEVQRVPEPAADKGVKHTTFRPQARCNRRDLPVDQDPCILQNIPPPSV